MDVDARLEEAALSPEFADLSIEALARRMIADTGLSGGFTCEPKAQMVREPMAADTG